MKFKLKCVLCGYKKTEPASEYTGSENPSCPKCYGPMIVEEVEGKSS